MRSSWNHAAAFLLVGPVAGIALLSSWQIALAFAVGETWLVAVSFVTEST